MNDISRKEVLENTDKKSKQFLTNWLSNRKSILKNNVSAYRSLRYPGVKYTDLDKDTDDVLNYQLKNMNNTSANISSYLSKDGSGEFNKKNNTILIDNSVAGKTDNSLLDDVITHERTHSLKPVPQETIIGNLLKKYTLYEDTNRDKYINNNKEIYARLMTFRKRNNLTPNQTVTPENLKEWKSKLRHLEFNKYPKNLLLDLFNTVADNTKNKNRLIDNNKVNNISRNNIT